jgi:hypothetical protein
LLAIPVFAWIALQNSYVQTYAVAKATNIIESNLGTKISIGKVDIRLFNQIQLENVCLWDLRNDTLLNAKSISLSLLGYSSPESTLKIHRVTLTEAEINFLTDTSGVMNLTQLIDNLRTDSVANSDSKLAITVKNVSIENSKFRMQRQEAKVIDYGINFDDLYLSNLNIEANSIAIVGDTIGMAIYSMSFVEKSGIVVDKMRFDLDFSGKHMFFSRLRLSAAGSELMLPHFKMKYRSWADLSNFIKTVKLDCQIEESTLSTTFLSYFVPSIKFLDEKVQISGTVTGRINDFKARDFLLRFGEKTLLKTNFNISGLPNFDEAFLFVDIENLTSAASDIESIGNITTKAPLVVLPKELINLGTVTYKGNFSGFISDFVAFGSLTSDIGQVSMDIAIKPDKKGRTAFNGKVSTKSFDVGKLINSEEVGKVSMQADLKGKIDEKSQIEAFTDTKIYSFEALQYEYSNIKISGNLSSKTYVGSVVIDDPNLKMNFLGKIDFSDSIPVFDFSAFVPKVDFVQLNLNKADSISQASFLLTAKFTGSNLDNSRGEIKVVNSLYRNQNGEVKTADITVFANNTADSKLVSFKSEFAEGELRGKYNYSNIFGMLSQLAFNYIPSLSPNNKKPERQSSGVENPEFNDYIFKLRVKKPQKLLDVVAPGIKVAENTNVFGIYNPDLQSLTLKIKIPEIVFSGNTISNITIDGQTTDSTFTASVTTPLMNFGGSLVRNVAVLAVAQNDKINSSISWNNNNTPKNLGEIKSTVSFSQPDSISAHSIKINIHPSIFFLNDTTWRVHSSNLVIDSTKIKISNISITNDQQRLRITGVISKNPKDSVIVNLNNINLANANFYTHSLGYIFNGRISGNAKVNNILEQPLFAADIETPNLEINNQLIGVVKFNSKWYSAENKLSVNVKNMLRDTVAMEVEGDIFPETKKINFKANIQRFSLAHIAPLLEGNVSDLKGNLSGNLLVTGTFDKPSVNGTVFTNGSGLTVDFLKTNYRLTDPITIENSNILFKNFKVIDPSNRIAILNGSVQTEYFKNFSLNLNLAPSNFQFMNTTEKDNELFYGTVFATGQVQISGTFKNVNMYVSVRTEPKTAVFLPLSSSSSVAEYNFVNFISTNSSQIFIDEEIDFDEIAKGVNLSLNLDLEVTPEADVQIIIDKKLGDIIKANGSGKLKMEINPSQDKFRMFGDYIIEKGDYLFTLQGVLNKKFRIADGSSLSWNGDVTDATMSIKAIYSLRTSLKPLFGGEDPKYEKRIPVDCQILLSGKLMQPNIKFNIDVPNADSETTSSVQGALNTEEKMSQQFLSLLVIGSFMSDPAAPGQVASSQAVSDENSGIQQGISNTVGEMFSNQLSNWLSQWSNNLDLGVNYRPGDQLTSNELEVALSTQLFNDRVSINGNVDVGNQNTSSPVAGDFSVDVKVTPSGKFRLKAFTRSNDDLLYDSQSKYTAGFGVMYREDFNTLRELWDRFRFLPRKKEELPKNAVESESDEE